MTNPLAEKILKSGLIDKATASLMEKFGLLEEGASDTVNEDNLKNATREKLEEITETLAEEIEKQHALRETYLDLERLRWPAVVNVLSGETVLHEAVSAVVDRQGRYYFRFQDVDLEWFCPGRFLSKVGNGSPETIIESQVLYIEEKPVAVQVAVMDD